MRNETITLGVTHVGTNIYWLVAQIMGIFATFCMVHSFRIRNENRIFHYLIGGANFISCITYVCMATNTGSALVAAEYIEDGHFVTFIYRRQFYYVRHLEWIITLPLNVIAIELTTCATRHGLYSAMFGHALININPLLAAAFHPTSHTSPMEVFHIVFHCIGRLIYALTTSGYQSNVREYNPRFVRTYIACAGLLSVVGVMLPIAWGLCEGWNVISPDAEAGLYAVLDILGKPVFGILFLLGRSGIDVTSFGRMAPERIGLGAKGPEEIGPEVREPEVMGLGRRGPRRERRGKIAPGEVNRTSRRGRVVMGNRKLATGNQDTRW